MSDARIGRGAESSINKSIEEAEGERIHLIGICGTAMATLAALLRHSGAVVSGSDAHVYPPMSDFLAREGIPVLDGYDASHITDDIDIVVVGNAVSRGNVELEAVLDRRLRYTSLPELLRDRFLWDARSIVIAGTHGKTTTTALAGWLLTPAGRIRRCLSAASRGTSATMAPATDSGRQQGPS